MARAWICLTQPARHGAFLQAGLDDLCAAYGALQPSDQYRCPICLAENEPGFMRPATEPEADRLSANQGASNGEA